VGDTLPVPKNSANVAQALFVQDTANDRISISSGRKLAGVLLSFEGLVDPTMKWPTQSGWSGFWQDTSANTTVAIWLSPARSCCGCGRILSYTGEGRLVKVEAADWSDFEIKTYIVIANGLPANGDVNYSGTINIADVVHLIAFILQGGGCPLDHYAGDLNCDSTCDIRDVVFLLNYIFAGGPVPCHIGGANPSDPVGTVAK